MGQKMPVWAMTALILGTITVLSGCGLVPSGGTGTDSHGTGTGTSGNQSGVAPSGNSQADNGNSVSGSAQTGGNQAANASGSTGDSNILTTQSVSDVQVGVPANWTKIPIGGTGDWSGYRFTNPTDANQQVVVVWSSCAGCYTDAQGQVNPELVIPHANHSDVVKSNQGRSVQYNVTDPKNPYPGTGMVTVSDDMSGYGYVEVYLPTADASQAKQILISFRLGK